MPPSAIALPPTINRLDDDQRSRLLRSARKLEALLGTTPQLLDSEEDDGDLDDLNRGQPVRMSGKRQGIYGSTSPLRAFSSPSSSSISSLDSLSDHHHHHHHHQNTEYLKGGDAADCREGLSSLYNTSPSSSRSPSPVLGRSCSQSRKNIGAKAKTSNAKAKHGHQSGPQSLSQPLLLRLRALPTDGTKSTISIVEASGIDTTPKAAQLVPIFPAPMKLLTPFERRKLKVDSVLGPLSPINHSHFHSHSHSICVSDLPPSPVSPISTPESPLDVAQGLTDREKRRKMAKLQRTLGENIPPELVFGAMPSSTTTMTEKKTRRRSYSMSILSPRPGSVMEFFAASSEEPKEKKDKGKGKAKEIRPLPSPPSTTSAPAPKPAIRPLPPTPPRLSVVAPFLTQTRTSPPTSSVSLPEPTIPTSKSPSTLTRTLSSSRRATIKKPRRRPRSLTLGTTSAFVTAELRLSERARAANGTADNVKETKPAEVVTLHRGTVSLDEERSEWKSKAKEWTVRAARSCERSSNRTIRSGPLANHGEPPFAGSAAAAADRGRRKGKGKEVWRRKEKEWSGEWNVKDMDEVAKALRGLKAR